MKTPTSPNFIYSIKNMSCAQCKEKRLLEQDNDGTPQLLCASCGYRETIPNFRHNTLDKLQFIRQHQPDQPTFENITK